MVLEYFWPNIVDGDDDVWLQEVLKYGDTVAQSAQLEALEAMGVDNVKFMMNGCENDLLSVLDEGCPVPIGILHKGPIKSPTGGGHWVTLIGYDDDSFFVHDPFGELDVVNGDYIETHPVAGCFQKYSRDNLMKKVACPQFVRRLVLRLQWRSLEHMKKQIMLPIPSRLHVGWIQHSVDRGCVDSYAMH